ncbi:MAG TPA: chemotaxis protein CheW [Pirellulales bacterium]
MSESDAPFILLQVAGTTYGLPAARVQQMEMLENVTPVPNAANYVDGVVFSRGQVVPAVNLRVRFGFERIAYDAKTRLVVVATQGRSVGLIVDAAREFVSIAAEAIQPPPPAMAALSGKYLANIATLGERLVMILDINELLNFAENTLPAPAEA